MSYLGTEWKGISTWNHVHMNLYVLFAKVPCASCNKLGQAVEQSRPFKTQEGLIGKHTCSIQSDFHGPATKMERIIVFDTLSECSQRSWL
ncbi:conserved hypothetical protein [Coccidioides posadasii str. Silveira]|uniref:Uncharacterized protein n=2 Tax=Coccidioides posadasii TaxID=199306 RepID=E9DI93_COCPS|nr:conserved hypothetical protein [Coccidioides posadasii str. Silveira]KMM67929.1 hypothetical protein CPAG_04262 [Coccidioides posadasii RMSCC 3488]